MRSEGGMRRIAPDFHHAERVRRQAWRRFCLAACGGLLAVFLLLAMETCFLYAVLQEAA